MSPNFSKPLVRGGTIVWVSLFFTNGGVDIELSSGGRTILAGGRWPDPNSALAAAEDLANDVQEMAPAAVSETSLAGWVRKGARLFAAIEQSTGRWSVVAGFRKKFEDTGLRYQDQESARRAIAAATGGTS